MKHFPNSKRRWGTRRTFFNRLKAIGRIFLRLSKNYWRGINLSARPKMKKLTKLQIQMGSKGIIRMQIIAPHRIKEPPRTQLKSALQEQAHHLMSTQVQARTSGPPTTWRTGNRKTSGQRIPCCNTRHLEAHTLWGRLAAKVYSARRQQSRINIHQLLVQAPTQLTDYIDSIATQLSTEATSNTSSMKALSAILRERQMRIRMQSSLVEIRGGLLLIVTGSPTQITKTELWGGQITIVKASRLTARSMRDPGHRSPINKSK